GGARALRTRGPHPVLLIRLVGRARAIGGTQLLRRETRRARIRREGLARRRFPRPARVAESLRLRRSTEATRFARGGRGGARRRLGPSHGKACRRTNARDGSCTARDVAGIWSAAVRLVDGGR